MKGFDKMKGIKRTLSLAIAVAIAASFVPAAFAEGEVILPVCDFESAQAGWSLTIKDADAIDSKLKQIDGCDGLSVAFKETDIGADSPVTAGTIVEEDGNKYLELSTGGRATKTERMPRLVIDNMPQSDAETGKVVVMSFDAMLKSNSNKTPKLCVADGIVIGSGEYGVVADKWQKYTFTLSAADDAVTVDVDGTASTINEVGITSFGDIYNGITGTTAAVIRSGSILIDNIEVKTEIYDNSPEGRLDRYIDSIAPESVITEDMVFAGSNSTYEINWEVSDKNVISEDGKVTPQIDDTNVKITITGQEYMNPTNIISKEYQVTVKGVGDLSAEQSKIEQGMIKLAEDYGVSAPEGEESSEGDGTEYVPAWFEDDLELPVYESGNGWVTTSWSSDNAVVKIVGNTAKIQPPVEENTKITLTAKVYCERNADIVNEKDYIINIVAGSGGYDYDILEVFTDIDFSDDAGKKVALGSTVPEPVSVGDGQAELKCESSRSDGGGNPESSASVNTKGQLYITNGQFGSGSRNCKIVFTNAPKFSILDRTVMMRFTGSFGAGTAGEPTLVISSNLNFTPSDLGVGMGEEFILTLFADNDYRRLVVLVTDTEGNIKKIFDRSLSITAFESIENLSAANNGNITIDDIYIALVDNVIANYTINVGVAGATVEVVGTGISVKTGSDGTASFYLPKGLYTVNASCPMYYPNSMELSASGNNVEFDLKLQKKIASEIIDSFTENLVLVHKDQTPIDMENGTYVFSSDIAAKQTDDSELFKVSFALKDAVANAPEGETGEAGPEDTLPDDLSKMLDSDGSVVPLYSYDTTATVVATVTAEGVEPKQKEFPVKILNIKTYMQTAADELVSKGILSDGADASSTAAKSSLTLPKLGGGYGNISVNWKSQNEYFADDGQIKQFPTEETTVVMTAQIVYAKSDRVYTLEQDFNILVASQQTILETVKAELDKINAATSFLSVDSNSDVVDATKFVSEDIYLPKNSSISNIKYSWTSDSDIIVVEETSSERIIGKFYPKKDEKRDSMVGEIVNLTVTASYINGDSVVAKDSRTISVPTKFDVSKNGKYKVRGDAAYDGNYQVSYNDKERDVREMTYVDDRITDFKKEGYFGSGISWDSSSTALSVYDNKIEPKNVSRDTDVTLTIKMYAENSLESAISTPVKLTVLGTGDGGGGSGGPSGGSGSNISSSTTIIGGVTGNTNTPASSSQFTDLDSVSWAQEAIESLASKGVVAGKQNGIFAPNDNITRAEFAQMLIKALNVTDDNAVVDVFSDVNYGDWYYTSVATAYNREIIAGYDNGTFGVNDNITRQDMATIVYRAALSAGISIGNLRETVFNDKDSIAEYAKGAVTALANAGIINGMTDTEFEPYGTATRAQAAVIIYNITK